MISSIRGLIILLVLWRVIILWSALESGKDFIQGGINVAPAIFGKNNNNNRKFDFFYIEPKEKK